MRSVMNTFIDILSEFSETIDWFALQSFPNKIYS